MERVDGVKLVGNASGPVGGTPILFLHGAGQTRHSWGAAVREGYRATVIDIRGHGESGWSGRDGSRIRIVDLGDFHLI